MTNSRTALATTAITALLMGGAAGAVASGGGRDHAEDDGTTTGETTTTGTTGTTTGTTTTGSTTGTITNPTPTTAPRAPRITELEVDAASGDRIRLRAQVRPRGARVTSVRFTYRGRTFAARKIRANHWARTVTARSGDAADDAVITFRVRACAAQRCAARPGTDDA